MVLQNFADAILKGDALLAEGAEGNRSLLLSNAIYLSSWQKRMVEVPQEGSAYEKEFEQAFEKELAVKADAGN